jgi:hypothetical protein
MSKTTFFSSEPLFFKGIYIVTLIGACYVLYENIFLDEEDRSGLILFVLTLFGLYFIRRATLVIKGRKREKKPTANDN